MACTVPHSDAINHPSPLRRLLVPVAGVIGVLALVGVLVDRFYADPTFVPPNDFLAFWAAGRLNVTGQNPYDADALWALQRSANRELDHPSVLWYPPWVLAFFMPFGKLDPRTGQLFWLAFQTIAVAGCGGVLWRLLGGSRAGIPFATAASVMFYPVMHLLLMGQSGGWLLLGITMFLAAAVTGPRWLAMGVVLMAFKPHLFVPFGIVLFLDAIFARERVKLLPYAILGIAVAIGFAADANPLVFTEYLHTLTHHDEIRPSLADWQHPLVGYRIRSAVDISAFWIQVVPTIIVACLTPIYYLARRQTWNWAAELPVLVLAGMITAPYGAWEHDQVLLLIPVFAIAVRLSQTGSRRQISLAAVTIAIVNIAGWLMRTSPDFIIFPLIALGAYILAMRFVPKPEGIA